MVRIWKIVIHAVGTEKSTFKFSWISKFEIKYGENNITKWMEAIKRFNVNYAYLYTYFEMNFNSKMHGCIFFLINWSVLLHFLEFFKYYCCQVYIIFYRTFEIYFVVVQWDYIKGNNFDIWKNKNIRDLQNNNKLITYKR